MTPEPKLFQETIKKIEAEDERAKEAMAEGMLQSHDEYCRLAGRRKALADCLTLFRETLEDVMKE